MNKEYLEKLKSKALDKTEEIYKVPTQLNISADQIIEDTKTYTYFGSKEQLDTLFIFTHSGVDLPEQFIDELNLENEEEVIKAMYINRDAGTNWMITEISKYLAENPEKKWGIILHKINRNCIDANRITVEEQLPATPYKGISLWKEGVDKNKISDTLVDPFVERLIQIVKEQNPKFIFNPHTYDPLSGDSSGSNSHDIHSGKRPETMIIQNYEFKENAFGKYGSDSDSIKLDFINKEQINLAKKILNSKISEISEEFKKPSCTIDFPYVAPRLICGVLTQFTSSPQLIIEYRKDLFESGREQIFSSIIDLAIEFSN